MKIVDEFDLEHGAVRLVVSEDWEEEAYYPPATVEISIVEGSQETITRIKCKTKLLGEVLMKNLKYGAKNLEVTVRQIGPIVFEGGSPQHED